jgi:mannose/fructose-specific phosphotransferase system component IIA
MWAGSINPLIQVVIQMDAAHPSSQVQVQVQTVIQVVILTDIAGPSPIQET